MTAFGRIVQGCSGGLLHCQLHLLIALFFKVDDVAGQPAVPLLQLKYFLSQLLNQLVLAVALALIL